MHNFKNKMHLLIVIAIYLLTQIPLLINKGIFWDDWILIGVNPVTIIKVFNQTGLPIIGYYHNWVLHFSNPILMYRVFIFLSYLFSAVFLYFILEDIPQITLINRLFLVLVFVVFPVNDSRITAICSPYAISYFLFYFSFFLLTIYLRTKKVRYRVGSLILLFLSFLTQSFLVFQSIMIMYLLYKGDANYSKVQRLRTVVFNYFDFVVLPFLFWLIKNIFFRPTGLYNSYQIISFGSVIRFPITLVVTFYTSFIKVFQEGVELFIRNGFLMGLIYFSFLVGVIAVVSVRLNKHKFEERNVLNLFLMGILFFAIGAFPYIVASSPPTYNSWGSRHQLLLPLGVSFIIVYGVRLLSSFLKRPNLYIIVLTICVMVFSFQVVDQYISFQWDWYKQVSLIKNFARTDEIGNNNSFVIQDNLTELNSDARYYRFYEYSGMLKMALGDEEHFGVDANDFTGNIDDYKAYFSPEYNLGDYKSDGRFTNIAIYPGLPRYSIRTLFQLVYSEWFKSTSFDEDVMELVKVRIN